MARSRAVISLYDEPMWESIGTERWQLQQCGNCGEYRYPPAPICPHCLSMDYAWQPLSGRGTILSWVVFHRQYFPDYPAPYNSRRRAARRRPDHHQQPGRRTSPRAAGSAATSRFATSAMPRAKPSRG